MAAFVAEDLDLRAIGLNLILPFATNPDQAGHRYNAAVNSIVDDVQFRRLFCNIVDDTNIIITDRRQVIVNPFRRGGRDIVIPLEMGRLRLAFGQSMGQGAYGSVYSASEVDYRGNFGRQYVIKIQTPQSLRHKLIVIKEAIINYILQQKSANIFFPAPFVPNIYYVGISRTYGSSCIYIVNERLENTIKYRVKAFPNETIQLVNKIAHYLSNLGANLSFSHNDLSYENILIDIYNNPRIIDFGFSRLVYNGIEIKAQDVVINPSKDLLYLLCCIYHALYNMAAAPPYTQRILEFFKFILDNTPHCSNLEEGLRNINTMYERQCVGGCRFIINWRNIFYIAGSCGVNPFTNPQRLINLIGDNIAIFRNIMPLAVDVNSENGIAPSLGESTYCSPHVIRGGAKNSSPIVVQNYMKKLGIDIRDDKVYIGPLAFLEDIDRYVNTNINNTIIAEEVIAGAAIVNPILSLVHSIKPIHEGMLLAAGLYVLHKKEPKTKQTYGGKFTRKQKQKNAKKIIGTKRKYGLSKRNRNASKYRK